jgi:hypothetical protein
VGMYPIKLTRFAMLDDLSGAALKDAKERLIVVSLFSVPNRHTSCIFGMCWIRMTYSTLPSID